MMIEGGRGVRFPTSSNTLFIQNRVAVQRIVALNGRDLERFGAGGIGFSGQFSLQTIKRAGAGGDAADFLTLRVLDFSCSKSADRQCAQCDGGKDSFHVHDSFLFYVFVVEGVCK